jgi:hypothetical protein
MNETFLVREHRSGFHESMKTLASIKADKSSLVDYIKEKLQVKNLEKDMINFQFMGHDTRNDWNTYMITINNYGVFGYCNGNFVNN